jgi:hypothetical protein
MRCRKGSLGEVDKGYTKFLPKLYIELGGVGKVLHHSVGVLPSS